MRIPKPPASKGSQKWLQILVNECPNLLPPLPGRLQLKTSDIQWRSPLRLDDYAEYRDEQFLDLLGIKLKNYPLNQFWPPKGPQWDGLAKTGTRKIILVEAKSHIGEMQSGGSQAKNSKSKKTIARSLNMTRQFLGVGTKADDWAERPYYQYANRLAHLYLLAELNGIDAYLMMIYFLNDAEQNGPTQISQWEEAIREQNAYLGLPGTHLLSNRVIHLYPDVLDIKQRVSF